jgi:hypothetical protein
MKKLDEVRVGLFTKEQEKKIDELIRAKNPLLEAIDGPIISMVDNQGLARLELLIMKISPEIWPFLIAVIDAIFENLELE